MPNKILIIDQPSLNREALSMQLKFQSQNSNMEIIKVDTLNNAEKFLDAETTTIFMDVFAYPIENAIHFVSAVRYAYPWITFVLFVWSKTLNNPNNGLSEEWQRRFGHYYRIYKDSVATRQFGEMTKVVFENAIMEFEYYAIQMNDLMKDDAGDTNSYHHSVPTNKANLSLEDQAFISYAHEDIIFVDWLWQQISVKDYTVWLDRKDIRPGEIWDDKVHEALRRCAIMLLILSPSSMSSPNVKKEWAFFMSLNKPIIPILWEDTDIHFQLINLQQVNLKLYRSEGLEELFARLKDLLVSSK